MDASITKRRQSFQTHCLFTRATRVAIDASGLQQLLQAPHQQQQPYVGNTTAACFMAAQAGMPRDVALSYLPAGMADDIPQPTYTKDPNGGWLWGNHPGFSHEHMACVRKAVTRNKRAFAYSVADLPGYHGDVGPMRIQLDDHAPVFTPPRRYSVPEQQAMTTGSKTWRITTSSSLRSLATLTPARPFVP